MQALAFRDAAIGAQTRGANRAAIEGFTPIKACSRLARTVQSRGNRECVQISVSGIRYSAIFLAKPVKLAGLGQLLKGDWTALKESLVGILDSAVPEVKTARQGASEHKTR